MIVLEEPRAPWKKARADLPRLGEPAPAFEAVTTQGTIRLSDYEGNWLILFSHPTDLTPVRVTEFIGFAEIYPKLCERQTELLGLSADSVRSHTAWVRSIEDKTGVTIGFPVIADPDRKVATAYGMVMPGDSKPALTSCVFVIDPRGVLRAMTYRPFTTARDMDEILRLVDTLQAAYSNRVAGPANPGPGGKLLVPAPAITKQVSSNASPDWNAECPCGGTHLTAREIDVLVRTAAGMSAKQIAASLFISRRTVEYHVAAILRRIAAGNAVQAVSWCYAVGVLLPDSWPPRWSGKLCIASAVDGVGCGGVADRVLVVSSRTQAR